MTEPGRSMDNELRPEWFRGWPEAGKAVVAVNWPAIIVIAVTGAMLGALAGHILAGVM